MCFVWGKTTQHLKEVSQTAVSGDAANTLFFLPRQIIVLLRQQSIKLPKYLSSKIDYEAELAVVIGKTAKIPWRKRMSIFSAI